MKQQQQKTVDANYKHFEGNLQTLDMCEINIYDNKLPQ